MKGSSPWATMVVALVIVGGANFTPSRPAWALDKQGSAHGGVVEGGTTGFAVSGSLSVGVAPYNPSYAARPDNTGHTFMRYAAHLDIDLIGRRLSVPIDVNVLTDWDRAGARTLLPTELDLISGLTSTWAVGPGALEVGTRVEHDRPVDRAGTAQSYVDVRARYLLASGEHFPDLRSALRDGGISGWATLGWFAYNTNYFARPDNTGLALFRYVLHAELAVWRHRLALGIDGTFFSDRQAGNVLRPSELDLTPALMAHLGTIDVVVAYERDMPFDRGGLVQQLVYVLVSWSFSS